MSTPTGPPTVLTQAPPVDLAVAAQRALRVPAIAASLLPREIVEGRRDRRVRRTVLAGLAAFTAVLVAWYGLMTYQTSAAARMLADAEADSQAVVHQQRVFGDVVRVQAESQVITGQLAALLATDLQWPRLFGALTQAAPPGVQLTGLSGGLTVTTDGAVSATVQLPNTSGERSVGTLTVTGTALTGPSVAAYLDALGKIKGLANPMLAGMVRQDGRLNFSVQLNITTGATGGRYSAAGAAAAGGN
jgi:type IV pilus assembly protein PilN